VTTGQSDLLKDADQQLINVVTDRSRYFRVLAVSLLRCTLAFYTRVNTGVLSPRGQRGLEAKIFGLGLGLVASGPGLVLGLMQCWPHSHEGCPRGLVVSHRNHVTYVTFLSDKGKR